MSGIDPHIAGIRTDYTLAALDEATAGDDPFAFFQKWFSEAEESKITEVNAMALATADGAGRPHARIVLLKALENNSFHFFTNYDSAKGNDLLAQPYASLLFFWKELERQVRIEGKVEKVEEAESDQYFNSRPAGSRLGAWASPQSRVIPDRQILDDNYKEYQQKFADAIPRPPHWGGYRLIPSHIEFWQGRSSRMHDRILFTLTENGKWEKSRLAP